MSPVALPNHDRWVTAIGNEVRLRLMLGNETVEELARQAILRKYSNSIDNESSKYWDVIPLIIETLTAYIVQSSSAPVVGVEPYRAIHPNSLYLTFRFHCITPKLALQVAEKLYNGDYEIEIAFYFGGIRETHVNFVSITGDQLKSVLSKTTADGGNTNATYIHRNQASKYVGRYVVNVKKMMYIENPNANLSQITDGLEEQFTALFQQAMENSQEQRKEADIFRQLWSPYDLNPDRITEELSKIFTYNDTETKRRNDTSTYYDFNKANMNANANSHSASGGGSVSMEAHLSIPFVSAGGAVSAGAYGATSGSSYNSLYNQLNETTHNQFSSEDIQRMFTQQGTELEFKGEKITPKAFQVYKLADLIDQVQVGIISKQLIAEKKDGAIVKTVSALSFSAGLGTIASTTATSITSTLTTASISSVLPPPNMILTGEIRLYSGDRTVLPAPWLLCNGSAISRKEFSELFRVIGINYGSGDGIHTFNLPDFRGRVPVGVDELQVNITEIGRLGSIGGQAMHRLTIDQIPPHQHSAGSLSTSSSGAHLHSIYDPGHDHGGKTGNSGPVGTGSWGMPPKGYGSDQSFHSHTIPMGKTGITINSAGSHDHMVNIGQTGSVGLGQKFSLMQPYQTVNYIIYAA
ncbi:unnamed protein product [Rotaria sp. Silwood1]|nr:unnamed protein product [Rotaria sp. Silwood1]